MVFYSLLADIVLVVHFLFVIFVLFGFVAILTGRLLGWLWVRNRIFRIMHLTAIGIVVLQAWLGRLCPLTALEIGLREKAGQSGYDETFMQHWLHKVLFFDAQAWVFTAVYTLFGLLVLASWLIDRNGNHDA